MRLLSPNAARVLATFLAAPTGSFYGYELLQETGIKSGSLYPVLGRFENLGWIQGEMQESPGSRPARRVYRLNPSGTAEAQAALERVLEERQQSLQDLGVLGI